MSDAAENTSWRRRHAGGALALAIWLNRRCEASVHEGPGAGSLIARVACDTADDAKTLADDLLQGAFPHDCRNDGCPGWEPFGRPRVSAARPVPSVSRRLALAMGSAAASREPETGAFRTGRPNRRRPS